MLDLKLREEFRGARLKGTAIELQNEKKTGATQIGAAEFLEITYPTDDVLFALEAVGPAQSQPVVLIGERGQGKSHLLAVLYHAFTDPAATIQWLKTWAGRLAQPKIGEIKLRPKMHVISESLQRQNFKFLWDIIFSAHPNGEYIRGKWEALGAKKPDVPGDVLLLELFKHTPTALVFDELQTWFDGLTNAKEQPLQTWAFNFIQLLSGIAENHPELLVFVVSVRNGDTEAYKQIHRVNPKRIDFKGKNKRRDRLRLLLHRLFENRMLIPPKEISKISAVHVSEYLRLADVAPAEHQRVEAEFVEAWPFAPHLMTILEDQVLVAVAAQETRDLIRILADVFKTRGEISPVITAADFRLEDDTSGIAALIDSMSNLHHANLRERAQRNLSAVRDAVGVANVPHLDDLIGALWLRSLAIKNAGAEPSDLQADVTRAKKIDDNAFSAELSVIVENSFNIHQDGIRYVFREEENPQAKLIANARNDKLFTDSSDKQQLAREVRYVIGGSETAAKAFRIIVLSTNWVSDPWEGLEESDLPAQWDERIPLLVIPEPIPSDKVSVRLGTWLKERLQTKRNAVRFLLSREGNENIFTDRALLVLARAVLLADKWKTQNPEFRKLHQKYERELRDILKRRFDRFAILGTWNYQEANLCSFHVEGHGAEGASIPETVDALIAKNLFVAEDFESLVLIAAQGNESAGKLIRELQEPRPAGEDCIPWLGETLMKEKLTRVCAHGKIAINLRGMEYMQVRDGEDDDTAWKRMRGKLGTGKHLDETYVLLPQAVPQAQGFIAPPAVVVTTLPIGAPGQLPLGVETVGGLNPVPVSQTPEIFGGATKLRALNTDGATSALNLLGKLETWGIVTGTQVQDVQLKVSKLTGAQLNELLRKLPEGITYDLQLNKEEK